VATAPNVIPGIYLQGGTEHTHGLTSTLLSHTAVRAGEIRESLLAGRATREPAPAQGAL
jgi:L-ornithine N5-oxygenase